MNNSNSNNIIKKIVKSVFQTIIIIALLLVICSINAPEFIEEMIKEYQVYIATFVWVIANVIQGILISNKCIYNGGLKRIEIAKKEIMLYMLNILALECTVKIRMKQCIMSIM